MPEAASYPIEVGNVVDLAKEEIWDQVGEKVAAIRIGGPDVLVVVYERPTKIGGIHLPDAQPDKDKWQGCSGLIVKLGPHAYQTEKTHDWFVDEDGNPAAPKVGDWIAFDPTQGHAFLLSCNLDRYGRKGRMCRVIPDQYAYAVLPRPDIVA